MTGQRITPVGPEPDAAMLLLGSLLWSRPGDARPVVAELVSADDLDDPALRPVLTVLTELVTAGRPHDGIAVGDELQRRGLLAGESGRLTARRLTDAITAGAAANLLAPRVYARAVVADAYRRRIEYAGKTLVEAASEMAEDDLEPLVRRVCGLIAEHARRLARLRQG